VWWPHGNYRPIQPNERGVIQQAIAPAAWSSALTGRTASPGAAALTAGTRMTATTVWPQGTPRPTPGHPQLALVLVPRNQGSQPQAQQAQGQAGQAQAPGTPPGQAGQTWVFPFNRPAPPGAGDNQPMAVATRDGAVVYDVAFALVTATTDTVLNANEAYAFASCAHCTAVAVSFQVVLIIGNAHTIAPKNVSEAVAYDCISCLTAAIAVQLDISLPAAPQGSTAAQLDALWTQVQAFGKNISSFSLDQVHAQLQQYEQQIEQIVQPLVAGSTGRGPVTLALVGTLASSSLTNRLGRLRQAQPGLDLRLRTALSAEVSALVLRGDADLGLRYGTDPDPGLLSVIIHNERLVPVCPPGHPLAAGPADLTTALAGQRWLAFPPRPGAPSDPYATALQQLLAAHGLGSAEILPVDSLTAQKRMVEAGFGLAILPESSLDEELSTGTLRTIDAPALTATIPVALIRRRNAFQSGAARALTAALTGPPH
jgi:DNA-binding transcriptional LysR family regulator